MANRLEQENSPYLLQHKDNPVDWFPWGEEALSKARQEDKPIFLSIGYAACHWCHVMERESFEKEETAAIMNEHFVNIKVDREERPDLDGIYMNAVVSMTGQGGWPMSVFLTPDGKPFFGGTYFPPVRRHNMPSFQEVLQHVKDAWQNDRAELFNSGTKIIDHINKSGHLASDFKSLSVESLNTAAMRLAQTYDWKNGGWGQAPKFPQPMTIQFLLRRAVQGDKMSLDVATHALDAMAKGGMYDVIGGGFARYSVDDNWLIPHFEKMLYDNAQLARAYLHAYLLTKKDFYRQICEQTLDFIARELTHQRGGFFSSIDADSEGVEGKFYAWSLEEIEEVLGDEGESAVMIAAYGISKDGNFEGANVLRRVLDDSALSEFLDRDIEDIPKILTRIHHKLYKVRAERIWPDIDDKVLVSWNALALIAFAEAARYLGRADYLEIAQRNAGFLLAELHPEDRLLRSWRKARASHNAYLGDYASLILGLLAIYQSDHDETWFAQASRLGEEMIARFTDESWGFYDTRDDHETLIVRPKDLQDNATPCGNSLAASALLELSAFSSNGEWHDLASKSISSQIKSLEDYPSAFGNWLCAFSFALGPTREIAILGDLQSKTTISLISSVWSEFQPNSVVAVSPHPPGSDTPPLLHDRPLKDGKPTAYVCNNFICRNPVNSVQDLEQQLKGTVGPTQ